MVHLEVVLRRTQFKTPTLGFLRAKTLFTLARDHCKYSIVFLLHMQYRRCGVTGCIHSCRIFLDTRVYGSGVAIEMTQQAGVHAF